MRKTQLKDGYQLRDSPFFRLANRKKLSTLLRVSEETLKALSTSQDLYTRRWKHKTKKDKEVDAWKNYIPENADEYRPIDIPIPKLKATQNRISDLLSRVQAPDFLFSPVKGRSYVENASHHVEGTAFWSLDVADYFPNCKANNVARFFRRDLECSRDVTAILVALTTLNKCLPQGSPSSPILAYYGNSHMWLKVADLVASYSCKFSLYADDITISGPIIKKELIWKIKKIIHANGFLLKPSKEISLIHAPADITGVIVKQGKTHLPNRQLKRLAELKKERAHTKNPASQAVLDNQISGRLGQRRQVERV
ncbi:reverse transcriptase family protein [Pseudovibrio japonicus]|uniref:reverse transcriptase family protein n=1 Tax=Pseudovibrio japonicus TaxID=366534 RepID=UPI001672C793|nr:reverse transcriptase family protein [Pseudovibrio japonicus]